MALGAGLIVSVAGISALMAVRVNRRATLQAGDFTEARLAAQSAIELGMQDIRSNPAWRQSKPNGVWRSNQPLGRGLITLEAIDPADGNLANNPADHLLMTGIGVVGNGRYKLAVELEPQGPPGMDCLASAVHTSTLLSVNSTVAANAPISSNASVEVGLTGVVNGDVEATTAIVNLGTISGTSTQGVAAKEMPSGSVFDYYIANAVPIALSALPLELLILRREIRNVVLSPGSNPYGGVTHPQGLYLLDCQGTNIRIENARIHGTLVILDPGLDSEISGNIFWERYNPQLPALLVRGSINFDWSGSLSESGGSGPSTNYNPPGSPYQGVTDADNADTYPSLMKGLVYVSGVLTNADGTTIDGVVVTAGLAMTVNRPLTVTHDAAIIQNPPPGFQRAFRPMQTVAGSWRQLVD